ncbi:MAG: hypothetical protein L3J39_09550 [Verrucomicrobiales bacterium]|nr:hypothetical protein [Verrucomicrobiales bacterium]
MIDSTTHSEQIPAGSNEVASKAAADFGIDFEAGNYYREASERLDRTSDLIKQHEKIAVDNQRGFSENITALLEKFLTLGKLDGLTIASEDGLIIAETHNLENAEVMVAIGSIFEYAAQRAQDSNIVNTVDEMTICGIDGELAVVRYFPNLKRRFFLMAYAKKHCTYRRITNLALKQCGLHC